MRRVLLDFTNIYGAQMRKPQIVWLAMASKRDDTNEKNAGVIRLQ